MPTADVNNNITVTIYDGTAVLGTDYNTSGITPDIHLPLSKIVWGNENVSRRVSSEYPMPVDVKTFNGNSGAGFLLGITGSVSGLGTFNIGNTSNNAIWIQGTGTGNNILVTGTVHGISGGFPVGVTGTVAISNQNIAIFGVSGGTAITVTGGRPLSYSIDSVNTRTTITGLSLDNGLIGFTSDSIKIYGPTGQQWIPSILHYYSGSTLNQVGGSGGAINVNLLNSGFTFTVNVSSIVGVTNSTESALKIQGGTTLDNPVLIRWHGATGSLSYTPISGNVSISSGSVSVSNTVSASVVSTGGTFASQLNQITNSLTGTTGSIYSYIYDIRRNTSTVSAINDKLSTNGVNVKVTEIVKSNRLHNGVVQFAGTLVQAITTNSTLIYKTGINIKSPSTNTSTIYVGNESILVNKSQAYPLEPGESLFLDCNNTNIIYCYADIDPEKQRLIYIGS